MPQFAYQARDAKGNKVKGMEDAMDLTQLRSNLKSRELYLTAAVEAKKKKKWGDIAFGSVDRREIITFTWHLSIVLEAGVPFLMGLKDLEAQTKNPLFRKIVGEVWDDVNGGEAFSAALSKHPKVFSPVYVNMVKAGEASGQLDMILGELTAFLEWEDELVSSAKRAATYPMMILLAMSVLVVLIFTVAFPKMIPILEGFGAELPPLTKAAIATSEFFQRGWHIMLISAASLFIGIKIISRTPKGRYALDSFKLRIPVLGDLLQKIALSHFTQHLGVLWKAGVDVIKAMRLTEGVVKNAVIAKAIRAGSDGVLEGKSLHDSLEETGRFPTIVLRMIHIGESTGNMEKTLGKVSQYYNREVPEAVKKLFAIFEPMSIIILAIVVLVILLAVYIPMYTAIGQIGR